MDEQTEKKPKTQPKKEDPYKSFIDALNSPSLYFRDFNSLEEFLEYRFFDPEKTMKLLVEKANDADTSPDELLEEMDTLISSRILTEKSRSDCTYQKWYRNLLKLETKYGVVKSGNGPDVITFSRICFLFPHYAVAHMEDSIKTHLIYGLPPKFRAFFLPEFGGLIPSVDGSLDQGVRKAIIRIHLFCLANKDRPEFHKQEPAPGDRIIDQRVLKRRIQNGLLSDERRVRFLEIRGVVTANGEMSWDTRLVFEHLQTNYRNFRRQTQKINWSILDS